MGDTKRPTISLAIIAKDEWVKLDNIIEKYGDYFDVIHIAYDCGSYNTELNATMHKYEWRDDFAHKRNWLAERITTDYYMVMDTDDELVGAENIPWMIEQMKKHGTNVVLCWYDYSRDKDGNCILGHYKEAIVKKCSELYWKGRLHESIVCDDKNGIKFYKDEQYKLVRVHVAEEDHGLESRKRNIRILRKMVEDEGDNPDPRTLALLGRAYTEIGQYGEAIPLLDKHINVSGWDEDRYISYLYLAKCLEKLGKEQLVVDALYEAIKEIPEWPQAYAQLCEFYHDRDGYKKAIEYGLMALSKGHPQTNMGFDPSLLNWKVPLFVAINYLSVNDAVNAVKYFAIAKKAAPNSEDVLNFEQLFEKTAEHYDYMKCFLKMLNFTKEMKGNVKALVESIPMELHGNEMIEDLRHFYLPGKKWGANSVVFFCGNTPHMWGPESLAKGIGGSEEAMIWLGRELAALGREVTVYNNCVEEVVDRGVTYKPICQFNVSDTFQTLIGWRCNVSYSNIKACTHVMWIHDIPQHAMLTPDKTMLLDKIVVLSQYHKGLLPEHLQDSNKIVVSTNGLVPEDFIGLESIKKQPKRIIYASSYDRGLELLVTKWADVQKVHPEAELHIYYGWNTYDTYVAKGLMSNEFKERMLPLLRQPGIYEHGRIGHKELLHEYAKSSVFAYPSNYTGEINCIALTKAIATGCNIVTNDFAVLPERSPNAVSSMLFIEELNKVLDAPLGKINNEYIDTMSWANVAKQWVSEVL